MTEALENKAAIEFVLSLRRRWADTVYPTLQSEFDQQTDVSMAPLDTAQVVHNLPTYPWFAWLERGSQKMLWRVVTAAQASEREKFNVKKPVDLDLDSELLLPDWYTEWDIHLQPGGVWSNDSAAAVYELGAKLVMLGSNDEYQLHHLFVQTAIPKRDYRRIVDLGCGFGKSTWPLKACFPNAEVIGIDLSAPCLKLAAHRASQQNRAILFRQANATATGLEMGSVDLVTSTMLVHEMPPMALVDLMQESARLLQPGGLLRFLDFQLTGDPLRDLAMLEHGARNNEPYMPLMMRADLRQMTEDAGLREARWLAFDERGHGLCDALHWPRRSEWHFPWAVFEASKPQ